MAKKPVADAPAHCPECRTLLDRTAARTEGGMDRREYRCSGCGAVVHIVRKSGGFA